MLRWRIRNGNHTYFDRSSAVLQKALAIAIAFYGLGGEPARAQLSTVVVRPKEIHDVLVNPGMGITTFQRFEGQALNPPLTWSEVGPVTKLPQAPTKPDFPETSISYAVFCLKKKKKKTQKIITI